MTEQKKENQKSFVEDVAAGVGQDIMLSVVAQTLMAPVAPVAAPLTEALHKASLKQTTQMLAKSAKKVGKSVALETAQTLTKDDTQQEEVSAVDSFAIKVLTNGRTNSRN